MAVENKNISDLSAAASVLATDLFEIQQGGVNKKATTTLIQAFLQTYLSPNNHPLTRLFWYDAEVANATGAPISTTSDQDIFATRVDANCMIELKASAVASDGSEGAAIHRTYHFRKDGSANPTLIVDSAPFISDESTGADAALTVSATNIRLTLTTPANSTYTWTVYAEIFINDA
jgi:hypothetical protein